MRPSFRTRPIHSAGFSLVELMVGMLIGMFGIIVMMQVFALSEERKRTTTGGGDAMTEGVMAIYTLQRDIRQGSYGATALSMFGCTVTLPMAPGVNIPLAPVTINPATTIIPAGDANTDTILVIYGNPEGQPQGRTYTAGTVDLSATNYYVVNSPCNPSPISTGATSRAVSGTLYDLGTSPKALAYAVRAGNLTVCDYIAQDCSDVANYVPIANNIVSLRAQYGYDTATVTPNPLPDPLPSYIVDTYENTPTNPAFLARTTSCRWARTGAIRFAVVSRSAHFVKPTTVDGVDIPVTTASPIWDGNGEVAARINVTKNPDGSANANWGNYRYKVFQTVVPIRNVAWLGMQSGC